MITNFLRYSSLLLFLIFGGCKLVKLTPDAILIKDVSIIDIESGTTIPQQSILIENGRITNIFPSGAIAYAAHTEIEATGMYVIPGLWDMHVHLRGGSALADENKNLLPLYITNGVTTVREAGGDITPQILQWKQEISENTLVGPTIFTSGPKLDGKNSTWPGSLELQSKEDVTHALDSLVALGVEFIKIYDSTLSEEIYLEILRQAEARGLKTTGHLPMSVILDDALDAGLDGIEHLYYVLKGASGKEQEITDLVRNGKLSFWGAVRELLDSYDEEKATKLFQKMALKKVAVTPTIYIDEVLSFLHEVDHSNDIELNYIGEEIQKTYARRLNTALKRTEASKRFEAELHHKFKSIIKPMFDAKVMLLTGSDNGAFNSYIYAGSSLHKELEKFVESGLTPIEVLQSSIINGATFFGVQDSIGTIEIDKKGDLLILNANPLEDIKNTTTIEAVIHNGKSYSKKDLQQFFKKIAN
tara:strand:+ start:12264 stop:13682 length:1419 start_codon:yes stop_codon:yes gene_type:complete